MFLVVTKFSSSLSSSSSKNSDVSKPCVNASLSGLTDPESLTVLSTPF